MSSGDSETATVMEDDDDDDVRLVVISDDDDNAGDDEGGGGGSVGEEIVVSDAEVEVVGDGDVLGITDGWTRILESYLGQWRVQLERLGVINENYIRLYRELRVCDAQAKQMLGLEWGLRAQAAVDLGLFDAYHDFAEQAANYKGQLDAIGSEMGRVYTLRWRQRQSLRSTYEALTQWLRQTGWGECQGLRHRVDTMIQRLGRRGALLGTRGVLVRLLGVMQDIIHV